MPAIKLFGRKWLAASDDLVYPGVFEICIRLVWLILIGVACVKYYKETWNCRTGGEFVRFYLLGEVIILSVLILLMMIIVRQSAKGSIMDTEARKYVEPLLTVKLLTLIPEIVWNILGSIWVFGDSVECSYEHYTITVVKTLICFDWLHISLALFGLALIFDPLGSLDKKQLESSVEHGKIARIWLRRFKFLWWMRRDESANEAFQHVAGLLSALFRGTNLVPSDVLTGSILLRIRQKREIHELRRLNLLARPKYSCDSKDIFSGAPSWMNLQDAYHYMKLSIACYGWLFVLYQHMCTGPFRLLRTLTCCSCFRRKHSDIIGDNCCYCYLAGVKYLSKLSEDDILYASFKNYLCEVPFCVIADHERASIVIVIRGSLSLRDIFTDFTAASDIFECEGIPPGSTAHRGMIISARLILKQLNDTKILEKAFTNHPHYHLTITGHSLGAGLGILLGLLLRPRFPDLRVYAFSTPAGLLCREACKITEEFVLTVGLGDDLVMRLSVESIENLRISLITTLHACRLPKYRVVLNGFSYILFGVPERHLNKTWASCSVINTTPGQSPLLVEAGTLEPMEQRVFTRDIAKRRFSKVKLYNAGRILHLVRCETEKQDGKKRTKKGKKKETKYEMRWAQPEEFTELTVMPRMLLDHLPENMERALATLVEQQKEIPADFDP